LAEILTSALCSRTSNATANANGGFFGNAGSAVALNVGGTNTNLSQIGG
jgi:hypothetical protein